MENTYSVLIIDLVAEDMDMNICADQISIWRFASKPNQTRPNPGFVLKRTAFGSYKSQHFLEVAPEWCLQCL